MGIAAQYLAYPVGQVGVRTWGNSGSGETSMLIGADEHATEVGARVLSRLPADVVLRGLDSPLIPLLASEISHDAPGQTAGLQTAPGDMLCVSAAELHRSVPNPTGRTRFSIEIRWRSRTRTGQVWPGL